MSSNRHFTIVIGLLAACAIASLTWQTVRFRQRVALRAAALKSGDYTVRMESTLPPWILHFAGSIDIPLPQSWRLTPDEWTLFQRTHAISYNTLDSTHPLEHFTAFNDAEEVAIESPVRQPEVLRQLAGYRRIKRLKLVDLEVGPRDLQPLCDISSEFTLTLSSLTATAANVDALRNASGLTDLKLDARSPGTFDCTNLRALRRLQRLTFVTSPSVEQITITHLADLANLNLTELDLGLYKVTDRDMQALARLPLENFHLNSFHLSGEGHRSLATMKSLKSLHLYSSLNEALVEALAKLRLESLHSPHFELRSETVLRLRQLSTLTSLNITKTRLSDAELDVLADLPLRELEFGGCESDDQTLAGLSRLRELERLTIGDNKQISIEALKNHARLEYLNLGATNPKKSVADILATCPRLKTIVLGDVYPDFQNRLKVLRPDITEITKITSSPVYQ